MHISNRIVSAARATRKYMEPRPSTVGDLPTSSTTSAALAGVFEGWISGGPVIAGAGLLGGYVGVNVGNKTGQFVPAIGAGALAGSAVATTAAVALSLLFSAPLVRANLVASAILGGFAGTVGTLSGSRRATTRDGVYGGMILGALGGALTHNPLLTIAGAAGGGIGAKAPTTAGRVVLGGLAGAATGAVSGLLGGPAAVVHSAAIGAALGVGGALTGPVLRQLQRNMTEDLTRAIITRIDPYVEKHGVSRGQKIALGAVTGVLTVGPFGLLFGLKGVAVAAGLGAAIGSVSTYRLLRQREQARKVATVGSQTSPAPPRQAAVPQASLLQA